MFPWFFVAIIDRLAWPLGYQTYVTAQGGPGYHRGRIGADRIHIVRKAPDAQRVPALKWHLSHAA
ncbi:hypothetical protein [Methylobacterium gnaphalii]|uniref:Uncharacterized protein n=1 Tax=Methylobacterium gnaphalii TaxID=1010610 RepID=A0A512JIP9_9HYPH|nr:hypothetical protein [Methylobacterium gnaphalii]GEP09826.1 hypothetical protein MGN01_16710 [Methylobacterium gnaphalii]GJD67259.1 hypothetical protein MMMDOFMJ_0173 [Methylobacterium gnaphalii]GLS49856.1 hypothetical protein GCM10007885_27080 [Methylobacterium gnaphalii]